MRFPEKRHADDSSSACSLHQGRITKQRRYEWAHIIASSSSVRANNFCFSQSSGLNASTFRTPRDGICDPVVDVRFVPAGAIRADLELSWERALGDLAVDGGARQPGPSKNGFQADDTIFSNRRVAVKHFRASHLGDVRRLFAARASLRDRHEALPLWGPVE